MYQINTEFERKISAFEFTVGQSPVGHGQVVQRHLPMICSSGKVQPRCEQQWHKLIQGSGLAHCSGFLRQKMHNIATRTAGGGTAHQSIGASNRVHELGVSRNQSSRNELCYMWSVQLLAPIVALYVGTLSIAISYTLSCNNTSNV